MQLTVYKCNLCGEEKKQDRLHGLRFIDADGKMEVVATCAARVHLCIDCAKQLGNNRNPLIKDDTKCELLPAFSS